VAGSRRLPSRRGSAFLGHLGLLLGYVALGVLVTWPHATYLAGKLPNIRDQGSYVWDMWWMAHQIEHLSSPFTTKLLWAPTGAPLAYHALMPLLGLIMFPVTVTAGPAFSVTLLSVVLPGLIAYTMYRAARLWLAPLPAFASGVFFGLSSMVDWRTWFHLNLAAGILFLPITLEAAVRLRRAPSAARSAVLGLVLGLMLLVDQESTVMGVILAAVALASWLLPRPSWRKLALLGLAGLVGLIVASPQIVAMLEQSSTLAQPPGVLAADYVSGGVALPQMFTPSPRVGAFGLNGLAKLYYQGKTTTEGMATFGVTLTLLALLGALVGWRQRRERIWSALWFCDCLIALGPVLFLGSHYHTLTAGTDYHGQDVSALLPYTWFVRLPGLSNFRYASRFTPLGLIAATLLAGSAVAWIRARRSSVLVLVAAAAVLELGWSTPEPRGAMPSGLPAVDRPIAADHSNSLVVDVPLGFRSGIRSVGAPFPPEEQVEATLDGHPRAIGYLSRMSASTAAALESHPFYMDLIAIQLGDPVGTAQIAAVDAERMNVGWVLVWPHRRHMAPGLNPAKLARFLNLTGFTLRYRADGVSAYRRVGG
jgi:hypothetical protein